MRSDMDADEGRCRHNHKKKGRGATHLLSEGPVVSAGNWPTARRAPAETSETHRRGWKIWLSLCRSAETSTVYSLALLRPARPTPRMLLSFRVGGKRTRLKRGGPVRDRESSPDHRGPTQTPLSHSLSPIAVGLKGPLPCGPGPVAMVSARHKYISDGRRGGGGTKDQKANKPKKV